MLQSIIIIDFRNKEKQIWKNYISNCCVHDQSLEYEPNYYKIL